MGRTARRGACVAIALAALAGPTTAATADAGDTLGGGCGLNTVQDETATNGQNQGVIYVQAVSQEGSRTPSGATVSCWIDVNGVQVTPALTVHGNGTIAGSAQISYAATDSDQVSECQQVTFDDGWFWIGPDGGNPDCAAPNTLQRVVVPPPPPPPAVVPDLDTAYCPYGSITGTGNWAPAETITFTTRAFVLDTNANCVGPADEAGAYHVVFTGTETGLCVAGFGSGTLSGSGPEGAISGSFTFYRGGVHLYISGTFDSGEEKHNIQYWIDVLPSASEACNYATAPLLAHGAIADSASS